MAENQALLIGFFRSSMPMLRPGGEINITLKKGKPYDLWNVKGLGAKLTLGFMKYETALHFDVDTYPGYTHRRTIGFKEGVSANDRAYVMKALLKRCTIAFEAMQLVVWSYFIAPSLCKRGSGGQRVPDSYMAQHREKCCLISRAIAVLAAWAAIELP